MSIDQQLRSVRFKHHTSFCGQRQWKDLLCVWPAALTLFLIALHQSVIAGSSFFLIRLIEIFQRNGDYRFYLICYLAAMLFPYLPGCASYVSLQAWINTAHIRCVERLSHASFGLTEKCQDANARLNIESVISRNSFMVINDYLTFLHGFIGFFLNSFLSMIVLGILLPGNLLPGYFISVALCLIIVLVSRKWLSRISTEVEASFISYSEILSKVWDNAILGNKYNFALWSGKKSQLANRYYTQSIRLQLTKQSGNLVLAIASLGPTVYLLFQVLQAPSTEPALLAAVIVNFTRIFHILNSLSSLVYQLLEWTSMTARLRVVFDAEWLLFSDSMFPFTVKEKIYINNLPITHVDEITDLLFDKRMGRFTIRGNNGSGKSTLLRWLKKTIGDQAMLIPSDQGDLLWQAETKFLSTGQSALLRIHEAASQDDIIYFLFDEWDANLDKKNTNDVNQLLNDISQTKVVIEVRH